MMSQIIKAMMTVIRLSIRRFRQIAQTSVLIIIVIVLNLLQ